MKKIFFLDFAPGDSAPFVIEPEYTGLAVAYENRLLIANEALPIVPVGKRIYKYMEFPLSETFQSVETAVGRKGEAKELEYSGKEKTAECTNHALKSTIPYEEIDDAGPNYDPEGRAVISLTNAILLRREVRVANMVFNASNYHSSCKDTLSTKWWDGSAHTGDPLADILEYLEAPIMRPTQMQIGAGGWRILRTHPVIVKAINGTSGDKGAVSKQDIMDLFELQKVLVGQSLFNTAKKGQAAVMSKAWDDTHVALTYIDPLADTKDGITFGFSPEYKNIEVSTWNNPDAGGPKGAKVIRPSMSIDEKIIAARAGFLISGIK